LTNGTAGWFKGLRRRLLQSRCVTLGKRIAAGRRALGWSQNELARRAEVNHPTLYKIEADQRRNPSVGVVVRIARALGTTAEALYTGEAGEESHLPAEAGQLAVGGLALIDELQTIRKRLDALETWRRTQEARARKRASR
jgi:transcriptional regulator with XRE-family HTH domain